MNPEDLWWVYLIILATMLVFRCVPILALGNRQLPPWADRALAMIPAAAFAALVANDLFDPELLSANPWESLMPLVATAVVALCALRTRSLALCAVVGVVAYVVLSALPLG